MNWLSEISKLKNLILKNSKNKSEQFRSFLNQKVSLAQSDSLILLANQR